MRLTLCYDGQPLGEAEFGPPNPQGMHQGTLRPNATYYAVRARFHRAIVGVTELQDKSPEQIHAYLVRTQAELAAEGLMLRDAMGEPVSVSFLHVADAFPLDAEPEVLAMLGIQIGVRLAPAT
jgi:hypothetical protein